MEKKIKMPVLSLNAKIEQFAKFLRTEASCFSQTKKEAVKAIKPTKMPKDRDTSITVNKLAEKLKDEAHTSKRSKKRIA